MRNPPLILIVDDDSTFLEIVKTRLEAADMKVETASSQLEAIGKAVALEPDLVLMDIHMPGKTGTDTALALKQDPRTKDLRIAFLSSLKEPWIGFTGKEREAMAKEIGMEHFLDKAEVIERIADVVKKILAEE